ncbi:MAG: transcriptional repressor, partial [Deltaproteobacteria bacterium]|nr:transcriptional repressor [Deltaproteobacteria bacterium]
QTLTDMGEMMEVTIDPVRKHYDPNPRLHHHVVCKECGRIGDVFADYSSVLTLPGEVSREFTVTGNHVDFYGVCDKCRS